MRAVSKEYVYQFNNKVREHVSEKELTGFFKVMETINDLINNKKIYTNNKKAV